MLAQLAIDLSYLETLVSSNRYSTSQRFLLKDTVQITGAVQYTKHLNSALDRSIENEVLFEASDWKLADICKDFTFYFAGFADLRKPGKLRERFLRCFQK